MACTMAGFFLKLAGRDRRVNARDVHLHNAPGADVQVAHFAVAHLPVGQAHKVIQAWISVLGYSRSSLS